MYRKVCFPFFFSMFGTRKPLLKMASVMIMNRIGESCTKCMVYIWHIPELASEGTIQIIKLD